TVAIAIVHFSTRLGTSCAASCAAVRGAPPAAVRATISNSERLTTRPGTSWTAWTTMPTPGGGAHCLPLRTVQLVPGRVGPPGPDGHPPPGGGDNCLA